MRIISGKYKGRQIPVRKGFPSRPTTDFAKENLFNILQNNFDFEQLQVLDLFSGTGSMSYEFASRGARVDLIEVDSRSFDFIKNTLDQLKIEGVHCYRSDVFRFVKKLNTRYDVIFADPPYNLPTIPQLPDLIFQENLVQENGWFILEHPKDFNFAHHARFFELRKYGSVHFSFFR